jgi:ribosomal protein L35
MNKSLGKKIRITSTGKIMRRRMGVGHNRTKKNAGNIRNMQKSVQLTYPKKKILNY